MRKYLPAANRSSKNCPEKRSEEGPRFFRGTEGRSFGNSLDVLGEEWQENEGDHQDQGAEHGLFCRVSWIPQLQRGIPHLPISNLVRNDTIQPQANNTADLDGDQSVRT